jgi:hypothetical protein
VVVAAYLYKKIGGPVRGVASPPLPDGAEPAPDEEKQPPPPGSAAKAMQARAAVARGEPHPDRAKAAAPKGAPPAGPKAPPGGPPQAQGAKPPPAPGAKPPPAPGADAPQGGGDELKGLIDEAAQEAASNLDPELTAKAQQDQATPPAWAGDADKWASAEAAVKPFMADYPDPMLVIAYVYKKMGGRVV